MKIVEFSKKYRLSSRDSRIAEKLYGDKDKEEKEWISILKKDFTFRVELPKDKSETRQSAKNKIEQIKAKKAKKATDSEINKKAKND